MAIFRIVRRFVRLMATTMWKISPGYSSKCQTLRACSALAGLFLTVSMAGAAPYRIIVVSPDRSQSHIHSVDAAIRSIPAHSHKPVVIVIRPGIYHQRIVVPPHSPPITFMGINPADTILVDSRIAYQKGKNGKPIGTFRTASTWIRSNNFSAVNLTFANDVGISGNGYDGQALAIRVDGDRAVFDHCRFIGWQDTILLNKNRQYFDHCRILGSVDFIFGNATAFFNHCHIVCLGYGCVTAPRTPKASPFGFVFDHCRITSYAKPGDMWLGRPWGPYASSIFMRCHLPAALNNNLFQHWNDKRSPETARFGVYKCSALTRSKVPAWIKQLTRKEASKITTATVLSGNDGWNPHKVIQKLSQEVKSVASHAPWKHAG